jgi:hypothetical protein
MAKIPKMTLATRNPVFCELETQNGHTSKNGKRNGVKTKSRHAVKHDGSLLRLVDQLY